MSCRGFLGTKSSIRRKLVLLGDATIIKASLLNVFTQGYFSQIYEPIIFENYVHNIQIDNKIIELALWDTTGQEEFNHLRKLSYADAHVVMLCFSVDNRDSLKNIESKWIEDIMEHCPSAKIILVALKCDLRTDENITRNMARYGLKPISYEEGLTVAKNIKASGYIECSAKQNWGVKEAFEEAARLSLSVRPKGVSNDPKFLCCCIQ